MFRGLPAVRMSVSQMPSANPPRLAISEHPPGTGRRGRRGPFCAPASPAVFAVTGLLLSAMWPRGASAEDWSVQITPYIWAPGIDTSLNVGPNPPVDGSTSILDILDGAFLIGGRATRDRWSVFGELNYLSLGDDIAPGISVLDASWSLDGVMGSLSLGYAVHETARTRTEVFGGVRAWSLDVETKVRSLEASVSRSWTDPIVGARVETDISDRVSLAGLVDVGGFGVGSDLQWEALAEVSWSMTDNVALVAGYRYLELDFDDDGLVLDMALSGPFLAVTFGF